MENSDIRWKQRFSNFEKVLSYLRKALAIQSPDFTNKAGIIHFFEMAYELSWQMLKDYLEEQGFTEIRSPREAVEKAFQYGLLSEGGQWLQLLKDRNLTSHTYDEEKASEIETLIREKYFPLFQELYDTLRNSEDRNQNSEDRNQKASRYIRSNS